MYHLIFQRKHELNAVNLTGTQSFPPFEEVVFCFWAPQFKDSQVVMIGFYWCHFKNDFNKKIYPVYL